MALDTAKRKQVIYFIGDEIENTVAKGFRTLFVVGTRDPKEIMDLADHHNCKHIYFGTSQSYNGDGKFATVMKELLENKGVEIHTYDGSEISIKGAGGPTCLTRPFMRISQ